jgi:general stress protein 26
MSTPQELEAKFWQALEKDMTVMLGLDGVEDGHARPMTAQIDGPKGPIWFFTSKDNAIVHLAAQWRSGHCNVCLEGARLVCDDPWHAERG